MRSKDVKSLKRCSELSGYRRHGSPDSRSARPGLWQRRRALATQSARRRYPENSAPNLVFGPKWVNYRQFHLPAAGALVPRPTVPILAATLVSGLFSAMAASAAHAAAHDGNWSVLVITEKGDCDRGYRYGVHVANGQVRYSGDAGVGLNGTVAPGGAVKVVISANGKGTASGSGHLTANSGSGKWRGNGNGNECAGRWEAERR
jgi:hypothetical protein